MNTTINESFIWKAFLNDLVYRQIITNKEKRMLLAKFAKPNIIFRGIGISEKNVLIKAIREHLGMEPNCLNHQIKELLKIVVRKEAQFSIEAYARKKSRNIVFLIYAMMAAYIEP